MAYSIRRFVISLALCYFVTVFFSPFSIAVTLRGEERGNLGAFGTFFQFVLVWFCLLPLPLGVWDGLQLVILAFLGLFSYLFFFCIEMAMDNHALKYFKIPEDKKALEGNTKCQAINI